MLVEPYKTGVPGLINWVITIVDNTSMLAWTSVPASVTGAVEPALAAALINNGWLFLANINSPFKLICSRNRGDLGLKTPINLGFWVASSIFG